MNYLELPWPALPEAMEIELIKICSAIPDESAINRMSGIFVEKQEFLQFSAPDYLIQWVKENLSEVADEYEVQLQVWKYSDYGRRHIDKRRDYSYNYLLMEHPGITRWFEDDGTLIESVNYQNKK